MAESTRWLTRAAAAILAASFAWLKLRGIPLGTITGEPAASVLLRASLVIYYFSWIAAVAVDTRDEEDVLFAAPNRGRIPAAALLIIISISVGFAVLCWVESYVQFVIALAIFWALNIVAWLYFLHALIKPAIRSSRAVASREGLVLDSQKISLLESYLCGGWQWRRYVAGSASIGLLGALAVPEVSETVRQFLGFGSLAGLGATAVLLHILAFEGWVWWRRLQKRFGIRLLERLQQDLKGSALSV